MSAAAMRRVDKTCMKAMLKLAVVAAEIEGTDPALAQRILRARDALEAYRQHIGAAVETGPPDPYAEHRRRMN